MSDSIEMFGRTIPTSGPEDYAAAKKWKQEHLRKLVESELTTVAMNRVLTGAAPFPEWLI